MSYCVAWKRDGIAYMMADSATSGKRNDLVSEVSSFNEKAGLYNDYYVQEGVLKIYQISPTIAVGYVGDQKTAMEAIDHLRNLIEVKDIDSLLEIICAQYKDCSDDISFELLITTTILDNESKIYHFNGQAVVEVDDFVAVGTGTFDYKLTNELRRLTKETPKKGMSHLFLALAFLQGYSVYNKLFYIGVGGVFYGVMVDKYINWFEDTHYLLYSHDILKPSTVSVIARDGNIFCHSDYDNGTRIIIDQLAATFDVEDPYQLETIRKILLTASPVHTVFCDISTNSIYYLPPNTSRHNGLYRSWIRRNESTVDYAFAFTKVAVELFQSEKPQKELYPSVTQIVIVGNVEFIPHHEFIYQTELEGKQIEEEYFDFDWNELYFEGTTVNEFYDVDTIVQKYRNIIIVDADFLGRYVSEKLALDTSGYLKPDKLDFSALVSKYLTQVASKKFEEYLLLVPQIKDFSINNFSINKWLLNYENAIEISTELKGDANRIAGCIFNLIKKYYCDERYFGIDKLVIVADSTLVDQVLSYVPVFNMESPNPDIYLVHGMDGDTEIFTPIRYMVIDYVVHSMLGLDIKQMGQLESGFPLSFEDNTFD